MEKDQNWRRILDLDHRLAQGEVIFKADAASRYGVSPRTIQRDIDSLRAYFEEEAVGKGVSRQILYDPALGGYRLEEEASSRFTTGEALAVVKILLESRGLCKPEMDSVIRKVMDGCVPRRYLNEVKELVSNERVNYIPPKHGLRLTGQLWELGLAIHERKMLRISYCRTVDGEKKERLVKPVGLLFSEYYFYLCAFLENVDKEKEFESRNDPFPTIYRVDRIVRQEVLDERFTVPYSSRFQEGEFRKRVQFMYGGTLQHIRFRYKGPDVTTVLDRLPTARIEREDPGPPRSYVITAEVFGKGIDMWIRSQGEYVEIV